MWNGSVRPTAFLPKVATDVIRNGYDSIIICKSNVQKLQRNIWYFDLDQNVNKNGNEWCSVLRCIHKTLRVLIEENHFISRKLNIFRFYSQMNDLPLKSSENLAYLHRRGITLSAIHFCCTFYHSVTYGWTVKLVLEWIVWVLSTPENISTLFILMSWRAPIHSTEIIFHFFSRIRQPNSSQHFSLVGMLCFHCSCSGWMSVPQSLFDVPRCCMTQIWFLTVAVSSVEGYPG